MFLKNLTRAACFAAMLLIALVMSAGVARAVKMPSIDLYVESGMIAPGDRLNVLCNIANPWSITLNARVELYLLDGIELVWLSTTSANIMPRSCRLGIELYSQTISLPEGDYTLFAVMTLLCKPVVLLDYDFAQFFVQEPPVPPEPSVPVPPEPIPTPEE